MKIKNAEPKACTLLDELCAVGEGDDVADADEPSVVVVLTLEILGAIPLIPPLAVTSPTLSIGIPFPPDVLDPEVP